MDTTTSNAATTAGGVDTGLNLSDVLAQVAAAMAAVSTSVNEITNKLNAIEGRIKQTSVNDDNNFETSVVGSYDPFDDLRRSNMSRDRIAAYAEQALSIAVKVLADKAEIAHGGGLRSNDHFCAMNPEVPSRTAKA